MPQPNRLFERLSPAEPITHLRHVPIVECGEPLVAFPENCPSIRVSSPFYDYQRAFFVRDTVAAMLERAARKLPQGYELAVLEGWRPLYIQHRMYQTSWNRFKDMHPEWTDTHLRRVVNRFTAPVNLRVPPPHSTGGAVDVFLVNEADEPYNMVEPYLRGDPRAFPMATAKVTDAARRHRDVLAEAMTFGGMTNYPSEYWHWSHGDQGWAYRNRQPHAIYGALEPENWVPNEADAVMEPLIRVEQVTSR